MVEPNVVLCIINQEIKLKGIIITFLAGVKKEYLTTQTAKA